VVPYNLKEEILLEFNKDKSKSHFVKRSWVSFYCQGLSSFNWQGYTLVLKLLLKENKPVTQAQALKQVYFILHLLTEHCWRPEPYH
jgi:hypothetical protein